MAEELGHFAVSKNNPFYGADLEEPLADWKDASQYPPLKPANTFVPDDYLRIAWEVLRRAPKYRMHFKRLSAHGLLGESEFNRYTYFFSSGLSGGFRYPAWEAIPVEKHYVSPRPSREQSLGDYEEEHRGETWTLIHGHRWAMNFWGTQRLRDPATDHSAFDLGDFFAPSKPALIGDRGLWPVHTDAEEPDYQRRSIIGSEIPRRHELLLTPREIYLRIRTDMPLDEQLKDLKAQAKRRQADWALEKAGRGARLRSVGLTSFWLRAWDFEQANALAPQGTRQDFIDCLTDSVESVPEELKRAIAKEDEPKTFYSEMDDAVNLRNIDNWRDRAYKYLVNEQDFYRNAVAEGICALETNAVASGPQRTS